MGFREHLDQMIGGVEGAVAASVMGFDGIAIDTVETDALGPDAEVDIQTLLVEYSSVLAQLRQAAEVLQTGKITEVSVNTEGLVTLARLLSDDYFAVLAFLPKANYGKARYVLRIQAPKLAGEL